MNIETITPIVFIVIFFVCGLYLEIKLKNTLRNLKKVLREDNDNILNNIRNNFNEISNSYIDTITISTPYGNKTNIPAQEYFNEINLCQLKKVNLRFLDTIASTLIGLGIFGTFLGLTLGIIGFDRSSSNEIQESINSLLSGMGTAFISSLVGMSLSIIFTLIDKICRNKLHNQINLLVNKLDRLYYIDDMSLLKQNLAKEIQLTLSYTNENGDKTTIANAIREILEQNYKQTTALSSFSTDLALQLNNCLNDTLSNQMQEKIVPLIEKVVERIDKMSANISSPAADLIENMVKELKQSMSDIIKEFSSGLSGTATEELENLAMQLGSTTKIMAELPQNMENLSITLKETINEVKQTLSDISNIYNNANSNALQNMQEQNKEMANSIANATENMETTLRKAMSILTSSVQESVEGITNDISSKHANLLNLQDNTTANTRVLLEAFNDALEKLKNMNDSIYRTMDGFKLAQSNITSSADNLKIISNNMISATESFNKGHLDYISNIQSLQEKCWASIEEISLLLEKSGNLSSEYANNFIAIKQGLSDIFSQLERGLTEYSKTIKESTNEYLGSYANALKETAQHLNSTIESQRLATETLAETIEDIKNR